MHVPVIITTGLALSKEMITVDAMLKVASLLAKPFAIDELAQAVERVAVFKGLFAFSEIDWVNQLRKTINLFPCYALYD